MEVTLLGTGDTTGTPTVGCTCETCQRARELGVERTRFSIHIYNPETDEALLVDASPDFRHQFLTHDVGLPDAAVITHVHFDHVSGLGNSYRLCGELPVYASGVTDEATGESVAETIDRKYGFIDALDVTAVRPYEWWEVCGLHVELLRVRHPPFDCYGLVLEDPVTGGRLGITGDTTFDIPAETADALRDVDLLVAEAIVPASYCENHPAGGNHPNDAGIPRTFGTKHLTREGAVALGEQLEAERTRLVHVSHFYPADEAFRDPLAVDGERYSV